MKQKIIGKEIVKDIARGMADSELIEKYSLSRGELRTVFKQLANLRERRIQMLVADFRSGMTDSELMLKYQLSSEGLTTALKFLAKTSAINMDELETLSPFGDGDKTVRDSRHAPRNHPIPLVSVCEVGKPKTKYLVRDVSENGIGVTGMIAQVDETKLLAVVGDEFGEIAPFEFQAQCRWAKQLDPDGEVCAGFRITEISQQDVLRLKEFIQQFTFGFEEA